MSADVNTALQERLSPLTRGYHARAVANAERKRQKIRERISALCTASQDLFALHDARSGGDAAIEAAIHVAHERAVEEETLS